MNAPVLTAVAAMLVAAVSHAAPQTDLQLTSGDFTSGGTIPRRFTCDDVNDSPSLRFSGVPAGTRSMALIVTDPDAPKGTFTHWVVTRIPPDIAEFTAGSVPTGVAQGTNDFGKAGYGGPCPPSGEHRYVFTLYALDTELNLGTHARRPQLEAAMKGHILGQAAMTGRYARSR